MARFSPIQTAFNGGELSPLIAGRVDVAKYSAGCKRMRNFMPAIEGPAFARAGTWYVSEVKDSADRTWLVRFEFSVEDSYMLEFGDQYIRFYTDRAQVVTGPSTPYEVASPYTAAQLTNADGTFALRYAQSGDIVWIVHPSHPPYALSRTAPTSWTMAAIDFAPPPFAAENITATTIYASATTGSVNLVASASIFTSAHVGQYILLREKDVRDIAQWEAGKSITAGDMRRSDGKNYTALTTGTTGSNKPTHATGAAYDGDPGVQWQFDDAGSGWVKVTSYTSGTQVAGTVVSQLPDGCVTSGNATARWAFQAWNTTDGYPTAVTFFRERLVFARDDFLWFSVAGDFYTFQTEIEGEITDDAGFERQLASDRVNTIRWLSPGDVLLVGTIGDEWAVTEATTTDPFGPDNCKTKRQSTYGSSYVAPQRIGTETLFVQKSGAKVRAMKFTYDEDGQISPNIAAYSRNMTKPRIVDIAFQQEPWSVVWCARSDGALAACTFDREQDVIAWHQHDFTGGVVESVETIPAPDGTRDDLWLIVRYTVSGATRRYIAYMADDADEDTAQEDWAYSDMMLTYSGAPATTISGLGMHEGKEVWVLSDGARHPNRTVTGGEIELQAAGSKVQVGLPCPGYIEPMSLDGGASSGTAQGKTKRIHAMTVRVYNSLGGVAGPSEDKLRELRYRTPSMAMGSAPPPYTGDIEVEWDGDYERATSIIIKKDRPMPFTLVAIMPEMVVQEGR